MMLSRLKQFDLYLILFVIIFFGSFLLRLLPILNNNFPFTMDQGRDMLDIRNIVVGKDLVLIGPTTSLNGVFLGPFWYYLNVFPYILGGGNPAYLTYWMVILYQLTGFVIWAFFKNKNSLLALLLSSLFLLSPGLFYASRFSWSANPMPLFTVFFFLILISNLEKTTKLRSLLLGIIIGLSMQIEAAFAILFFPFSILVFFFKKKPLKFYLPLTFGLLLTLIPQILFELRHSFIMTHVFFNEISGNTSILGNKLGFINTILSHKQSYLYSSHGFIALPDGITELFIAGVIFFLLIKLIRGELEQKNKLYFLISLFFIVFSFIFYSFYNQNLKGWYLLGLYIPYLLITGVFLDEVLRLKKILTNYGFILVLLCLLILTLPAQLSLIPKDFSFRSGDKSNIRNELEEIDWIYQKAEGQGFRVYNYLPSVYDFPYQYLFWWYGTNKYGYQPDTISYLDNVPEYIPQNNRYWTLKKTADHNSPTFLIIEEDTEMPKRQAAWLGNFDKSCLKERKKFYWGAEVQIRIPCP